LLGINDRAARRPPGRAGSAQRLASRLECHWKLASADEIAAD